MMTHQPAARSGAPDAQASCQLLTFELGTVVYAFDIGVVREILRVGTIGTVPTMPDYVHGVIDLRGAVVPVIDLQVRFGRSRSIPGRTSCIVIFEAEHDGCLIPLGLMVDAVREVLELPLDLISEPPALTGMLRRDFLRGMGRVGDGFVIVLEPGRAIPSEGLAQMAHALDTEAA